MEGFKQCSKGHFFKEEKDVCPYCPGTLNTEHTDVLASALTDSFTNDETMKTQVFGSGNGSTKITNQKAEPFDATKTTIVGSSQVLSSEGSHAHSRRRLRGWLVSFDIEDFGVDFKILEGKNKIGSNASNEITVRDKEVSSYHALILCRKDRFLLTDEMSSNGTTINGQDMSPRDPYELADGDEIKIGTTTLLFKMAFK